MKTFIIDYTIKTRNGHMRDYRRFVKTDDLATAIEKMRLCLSGIAYGCFYKGAFLSATEVCSTDVFGYKCRNLIGGQYFFVRDGRLTEGTVKWNAFYDYKLKGWLRG